MRQLTVHNMCTYTHTDKLAQQLVKSEMAMAMDNAEKDLAILQAMINKESSKSIHQSNVYWPYKAK